MASYFKTGEHYYKSLDVFKEKSGEFVKNIEIVRYHMPSVIQKLPQNQTCFNILSVGRGGHGGLRYCGIGLFFMRYFGNFNFNVRYCGII